MTGIELFKSIIDNPIPYAHSLGLTKLNNSIHRDWIRRVFFLGNTKPDPVGNETTQGHRGSYKSSCVRVGLGLRLIGKPFENTIVQRKTDGDVKDIMTAISKDMQSETCTALMKEMFGTIPKLTTDTYSELELSNYHGVMGRQLIGIGIGSSITGKHGAVITDDIVTLKDRISGAERERTKSAYMELVNIASEKGQYIQNWGTPWHKDDAFTLMPKPKVHTVYDTGILSRETIDERKKMMTPSLFAANYELKHIADDDLLFSEPKYGPFPEGAKVYAQIDAAYGGADSTAITIACETQEGIHVIGKKYTGHIDQHYNAIIADLEGNCVIECALENNADKGFLRKELSKRTNTKLHGYHERMNKYYKISTYGKSVWNRVIVDIDKSDSEYISEVMDYNENAEHDDCPDSLASLIRWKYGPKNKYRESDSSLDHYFMR